MRKFFYQLIGNSVFFAVCIAAIVNWPGQVFANNLLNGFTGFLLVLSVVHILYMEDFYTTVKDKQTLRFVPLAVIRIAFVTAMGWHLLAIALLLWCFASCMVYLKSQEQSK